VIRKAMIYVFADVFADIFVVVSTAKSIVTGRALKIAQSLMCRNAAKF
jgi:hypothetical protein